MSERNRPIVDQFERLMDIEVGDSILWRGKPVIAPQVVTELMRSGKLFNWILDDDKSVTRYIVTRVK